MKWAKDGSGWTLPVKGSALGIIVHHHVDYGKAWLVTFYDLDIKARPLKSRETEAAKEEALGAVRARLKALSEALREAQVEIDPIAGSVLE